MSYLEQQGFSTELNFTWEPVSVRINRDYLSRIFDNLTSNLVKYAAQNEPVMFRSSYSPHTVKIEVGNRKKELDEKVESNKIGLQNIQKMMEKMGGGALVHQDETVFMVSLVFPAVPGKEGAI